MPLTLQLKQVLHDTSQYVAIHSLVMNEGNLTLSLSFPAPTGPPGRFIVTPGARNMTFSWSAPAPTLCNGVISGYFLSCVPVTGGENSISMQYTAAGTFTLGGFTPATSYNCSISASNSQGSGPVTYLINTTLEARKQVRL